MRHVISVLVENEVGALARVVGLFSARGFNIETLTVAPVAEEGISCITLVTHGNDNVIEQIVKQLNKLIPVLRVIDLTDGPHINRELMLIKVGTERETDRQEIMRIVEVFRARVVDMTPVSFTLEVTGDREKLDGCLELLRPAGILDVVRTGQVAMARGGRKSMV
jgi:acetolactate synthase-1/3 small subunit